MTHCLRVLGLAVLVNKHARVPTLWSLGGGSAISLHLLKVITPRALSQERTDKHHFLKLQMAADSPWGSCDNPQVLGRGSSRSDGVRKCR